MPSVDLHDTTIHDEIDGEGQPLLVLHGGQGIESMVQLADDAAARWLQR